jgi:hypothetical protein
MTEETFRCVDCREVLPLRLLIRGQHQPRCKGCNRSRFFVLLSSVCPVCGERKDRRARWCWSCYAAMGGGRGNLAQYRRPAA